MNRTGVSAARVCISSLTLITFLSLLIVVIVVVCLHINCRTLMPVLCVWIILRDIAIWYGRDLPFPSHLIFEILLTYSISKWTAAGIRHPMNHLLVGAVHASGYATLIFKQLISEQGIDVYRLSLNKTIFGPLLMHCVYGMVNVAKATI